jgi:predicted ferric reductase
VSHVSSVAGSAVALTLTALVLGAQAAGAATGTPPAAATAPQTADHTFWYVARAAGLAAYLVLFVNVCLGLAVHTRTLDRLLARWQSFDLHQFTAFLALVLLGLHLAGLLLDRFIGFTLPQLFIPFTSPYRPLQTALGIVALYMLVAITASFSVRRSIGVRAWRALHFTTYGAYFLALFHGLLAGTDASQFWAQALYETTGATVLLLTLWRFRTRAAVASAPHPRLASGAGRQ